MAKKNFGLNFDGFLDFARQVDELGKDKLKEAVENALVKSKNAANIEIIKAMKSSKYKFEGNGKGTALKSVREVAEEPVEWSGYIAKAFIGGDLEIAPEIIILAMGTPKLSADTNLRNALKVKGKYRKRIDEIQKTEFNKVLEEGLDG